MTGSLLIDGMMAFFTVVLLGAVAVPFYLFFPKWMEGVRDRRVQFHAAAIDAIGTELTRPQADPQQVERLFAERRRNVAALLSLDPTARVPAEPTFVDVDFRAAA